MSEENKKTVRRYIEQVWNGRRPDLVDQFMAEDIVHHDAPGVAGRDSLQAAITSFLDAFPDLHITLDFQIAEGDLVVHRNTISDTLQGELLGNPATGKHGVWSGIWVLRLDGGKIVELWGLNDNASMMHQLGMQPPGQNG